MPRRAELQLQREVVTRLRFAPLDAILVGSPNGFYIPARTAEERQLARRLVHQLKRDGMLTPGAPDLLFLWGDGCAGIELKRPEEKRLFDKQRRGVVSPEQTAFRMRCFELHVRYAVCESWPEVRDMLIAWGRLPAGWRDADSRIGRAA